VRFGAPLAAPSESDFAVVADQVEQAVRRLAEPA
jgi:hypothetical protein